jgi:hypothetical protein
VGNQGYLYHICGSVHYVDSSVELRIKWCQVVYLCSLFLNELPPSTVPRGRPITEGSIVSLWSYNFLVLLMCTRTCFLRMCLNFNYGHILEEHGCPNRSVVNWPIRVDPCSKSLYLSIYYLISTYHIITTINISILKFSSAQRGLTAARPKKPSVVQNMGSQRVSVVALCFPYLNILLFLHLIIYVYIISVV